MQGMHPHVLSYFSSVATTHCPSLPSQLASSAVQPLRGSIRQRPKPPLACCCVFPPPDHDQLAVISTCWPGIAVSPPTPRNVVLLEPQRRELGDEALGELKRARVREREVASERLAGEPPRRCGGVLGGGNSLSCPITTFCPPTVTWLRGSLPRVRTRVFGP